MMYTENDIAYESKSHWVLRVKNGFEVYKIGVTHSTRCAQIGFSGDKGLNRAITECNKRETS